MELGQAVKSGISWSVGGQLFNRALGLISMVILARLLSPSDFGVVAMAGAAWEIIQVFSQFGIGPAIIHHQEDVDAFASAAFWLNLVLATVLTSIALAVAPLVASFFNNSLVQPILILMSVGFLVSSLGSIHSTLVQKRLEFKKLTLADLSVNIATACLTIVMAFLGYGVWSLVIPNFLSSFFRVGLYWWICPWRPSWGLGLKHWRAIFDYGKYILGDHLFRRLNVYIGCNMIIGKVLGTTPLGLYNLAYQLAHFPVDNVGQMVYRVSFPALSMVQEDVTLARNYYTKILGLQSLFCFPIFVGLFVLADPLVPLVFGEKWHDAVVPLQIILCFAFVDSLAVVNAASTLSRGRADINFKLHLILTPFILTGILVGAKCMGITGAALAFTMVMVVGYIVYIKISSSLIGMGLREVFASVYPPAVCSLIMASGVLFLKHFLLAQDWSSEAVVLAGVVTGILGYILALFLLFRQNFNEASHALLGETIVKTHRDITVTISEV